MRDKLSFECIKPHLKTLRAFGFYQIDPKSSKLKRYIHRTYMTFILSFSVLYTFQQMMKINEVINDSDKVIDTTFLMLACSGAIYKEIILWKDEDKVEELLNILKGPIFNQNNADHEMLLAQRARQSSILLRAFNGAALTTCLLWVAYPAIRYAQSKSVEFTIWLPFDPNMSPHIYFALVYSWIQTSLLAIGNTSMDAFITLFLAQCKTQLKILRPGLYVFGKTDAGREFHTSAVLSKKNSRDYDEAMFLMKLDLKNIVSKCENESKDTSNSFAEIFHRHFLKIMMHYNEIVNVCQETQNIFGGVTLYLFLINIWVICTSAYVMANVNPISVQFSSMCMYMVCIMTELSLYCSYGNEVSYESKYLVESVFSMDWHKVPIKQRYNIIIFMERIKRPIIPMAGAFVPLSNTTFVSILRSSYSFYAFLKNTGE